MGTNELLRETKERGLTRTRIDEKKWRGKFTLCYIRIRPYMASRSATPRLRALHTGSKCARILVLGFPAWAPRNFVTEHLLPVPTFEGSQLMSRLGVKVSQNSEPLNSVSSAC